MSLFSEKLKNIALKEVLVVIIALFLIQYFLNSLNIVHIESFWIYILVIFYFIFKLKVCPPSKNELLSVFSKDTLKNVIIIVILNIFLSYGFLYLSGALFDFIYPLNSISYSSILSNSIFSFSLIAIIFISPISEELIFRGVFLNRMKLIVPPIFAVLISSLIFASLHSYGNICSAFVFGVCMAILYIKTDNIFISMFVHFLNNLLAEIIVIIDVDQILFMNGTVVMIVSVLAVVSFIIVLNFIIGELNNIK